MNEQNKTNVVKQTDTQINKPKQSHDKRRIIGIVVTFLIVIAVALFGLVMWLFVDSTKAVNQYVSDVDEQYQQIVKGKNVSQLTVKLREVPFGDVINVKYKKMKALEPEYGKLITSLRNYTAIMSAHNQLISQFNSGVDGKQVLNSDILKTVNTLTNLVKEKYPNQTDRIKNLETLGQKISSSTNFTDIGSEVNAVLRDDDNWLNKERQSIDSAREQFQQKINSI